MQKILTTIKHSSIVLAISIAIAVAIPLFYLAHQKKIDYKTFHTTNGWGYDILVNKKLLIHQECIPVMPDKKGFATEESAKAVARMVVRKLKNNQQPTVTYDELTQMSHN
jgi:hypothetical protein